MTNETKELKTYTMQELYEHPLEPMACLVDGLLAPGLYILGGTQSGQELDGAAVVPCCVRRKGLFGARNAEKRGALPGAGGWPTAAAQPGFAAGGYRGIPPPKTPRSMQPHGTGRCIMDQARRCCSSQTIRVGFSALMRRARTVNTRMVSSVKTTSHTAR